MKKVAGTIARIRNRFGNGENDVFILSVDSVDDCNVSVKVQERNLAPLRFQREYVFFGEWGKYRGERQFQAVGYVPPDMEETTDKLYILLGGRRFPRDLPMTLLERIGNDAERMVRLNPYLLLPINRCGFKTVDDFYLDLGHDPGRTKRQVLCGAYMLETAGDGSIWRPAVDLHSQIRAAVGVCEEDKIRKIAKKTDHIQYEYTDDDGKPHWDGEVEWVASAKAADIERETAQLLSDASAESCRWPKIRQGDLSDHQYEQVQVALQANAAALSGGGGTGKTFTVAHIVRECLKHGACCLCAPTGKAAVRMTEAMAEQGITIQARTVHSTLGWTALGWTHDRSNPLPDRFIFVDETSMVDAELFWRLLQARADGSCIMFIGDPYQLPPVGAGAPFRDLLGFLPSRGELTEFRRNSGDIVYGGDAVRRGHRADFDKFWSDDIELKNGHNLVWRQMDGNEQILNEMMDQIQKAEQRGHDPVWDVQVIAAVNAKSELSTSEVNKVLQFRFNPGAGKYREGDKVMNTKNTWAKPYRKVPNPVDENAITNRAGDVYVANGEIGRVLEVHPKWMAVEVFQPRRVVMAGTWDTESEDDQSCAFVLAYAITSHKSQGAQFPVAITLLDTYPGARRLFDRSLLYTAMSRSKSYSVLIGSSRVMDGAIAKSNIWDRKTFLGDRFKELTCGACAEKAGA